MTIRYKRKHPNENLVQVLKETAALNDGYGHRRLTILLKKMNFKVGRRAVLNILNREGLTPKRRKKKKSIAVGNPKSLLRSDVQGGVWGMDFVMDQTSDGKKFLILTVIDHFTRLSPGVLVGRQLKTWAVIEFLKALKATGVLLPKCFNVDNGSQFRSNAFQEWCKDEGISINFIDPGKPYQNGYCESFNGRLRDEFLSRRNFKTIEHAEDEISIWCRHYNETRPHSSLGNLSPKEFAKINQVRVA
jgi:putative transposase